MMTSSRNGSNLLGSALRWSGFAILAAFATGCVATTTDIDRLQDSLTNMQKSQADLSSKMDDLEQSLTALTEKLDDSQRKMGNLTQKLDDTQSRLGGRMESISKLLTEATTQATIPVPGEQYRVAYADYVAGKYDLAIAGFKIFLERYPESDLADDAQFYYADCFLMKKDYQRARLEFDHVLSVSREYRIAALLKRAYALAGTKQVEDEKHTLRTLIKEAPSSPEATTAKEMLEDLEKSEKKAAPPPPAKKPKQK